MATKTKPKSKTVKKPVRPVKKTAVAARKGKSAVKSKPPRRSSAR